MPQGIFLSTPAKAFFVEKARDNGRKMVAQGLNAQSCAYASRLATLCRPSSTPPGLDNFIALPPVQAKPWAHACGVA